MYVCMYVYCLLQVGCQSQCRQQAMLKPHVQSILHSGCYESIERLVVAQGKECAYHACTLTYCACAQVQILGARRHTAMPVNYSTDLRWRAVWLVTLRGMSYEEVGRMLFISERSVRRYVDHFYSTGNVDPAKQQHRPQCLLSEFEQTIRSSTSYD